MRVPLNNCRTRTCTQMQSLAHADTLIERQTYSQTLAYLLVKRYARSCAKAIEVFYSGSCVIFSLRVGFHCFFAVVPIGYSGSGPSNLLERVQAFFRWTVESCSGVSLWSV